MKDFETIAIFNYPHEIIILKHRLNQSGISYFFENENTITVAPFYSNAIGDIKLKIHPNDFEIVQLILEELNGTNLNII